MILSISIPVLNAIYPVSIVLIILGLTDTLWKNNAYVYPVTIAGTAVVSVVYALEQIGVRLGLVTLVIERLPLYEGGFGWLPVACVMLILSILFGKVTKR